MQPATVSAFAKAAAPDVKTVYFDYNATTPLDPAVREAMLPFLGEIWGNPSSVHQVGRTARAHLDAARERTAALLRCQPSEVIFTSGGTESVNLAVFGAARLLKPKGRHIVISSIEHDAVLRACQYLERHEGFSLTLLPVNPEGRVSPEALERNLRPDTVLVSIMAANNEIGSIQPVTELGALCHERGVLFHTDAVQWFGKEPVEGIARFNADLVSICGHKFHGPKGAGILFARSPLHPQPILFGGGHENERRAGTENLAGIIGLVEALERFVPEPVFCRSHLEPLTRRLLQVAEDYPEIHVASPREHGLANTVTLAVEGADSIALLAGLDLEGICASSGSACSAGSIEPSHVLSALGLNERRTTAMIRFSLGRESTLEEVEFVRRILPQIIERARKSFQQPVNSL